MSDEEPFDINAVMAEAAARVVRLNELLSQRPICDVHGVVHPSGTGSGASGMDGRWTFLLTLKPWKIAGGECQFTELIVRKEVPEESVRGLIDKFSAYDVVHLQLRVLEEAFMEDYPEQRDALLIEIVNTDLQDAELARLASELKKPKSYRDDYFGKLKLDLGVNWLVTRRWKGFSRYRINIKRDGETYDARMAWEKVQFVEANLDAVRSAIVEHLFDIYDGNWDSLGTLTPKSFGNKPKLQSVSISPDGRVEVWFNDQGLFLGHDIVVRIDKHNKIEDAHLAG